MNERSRINHLDTHSMKSPSHSILRLPDDPLLSEIADLKPVVLQQFLQRIIRANPQFLFVSPLLAEFMTQNHIHTLAVDAIDINVSGSSVGHCEIHTRIHYELREKPTASFPEGREIYGRATVVLMRDGELLIDVTAADVNPAGDGAVG